MSGTLAGWDWFGHTGAFQRYISRTCVIPDCVLTITILTNAADGEAVFWLDGAILRAFAPRGAPKRRVRDWAGRLWGTWGAVNFVPIGNQVIVANPQTLSPFLHAIDRDHRPRFRPDIASIRIPKPWPDRAPHAQKGRRCHRDLASRQQPEAGENLGGGDGLPIRAAQTPRCPLSARWER